MAATKLAYLADRRLRRKNNETVDDLDWYTNQWDPGMFTGTVSGAAAGSLTVALTPLNPDHPTPAPIVVTLTTETDAQAAEAVYNAVANAINRSHADYDSEWALYIKRMEYTAAATAARFVPNPGAFKFTVTLTPAGGATFTLSPDDQFPITATSAKEVGQTMDSPGEVEISVHAVTAADEMLGVGTATFDMQVLRVVDRRDPVTGVELRPGVRDLGTLTGLLLGEAVRVPMGGGRFGVRITNDANLPAGTTALDVRWNDVVT